MKNIHSLIILTPIQGIKPRENQCKKKSEASILLGEILAKRAAEKKITKVYFDRGAYKYHGRIKMFADSLRKNGLEF